MSKVWVLPLSDKTLVSFPILCLPNGVYYFRELSDVIPEGYSGGGIKQILCICLYYPIPAVVPTRQFGGRSLSSMQLYKSLNCEEKLGHLCLVPSQLWGVYLYLLSLFVWFPLSLSKAVLRPNFFLPVIFWNQRRQRIHSSNFIGHHPDGIKLVQEI